MSPAKPRYHEHLLVLGVYTAAALVMTWPLALHFGSAIPGVQGDVWSYLWALGWARVSLLDLGVNPFRGDYIFYPLGGSTQLLWATALPSFFSLPLQLAFGLVPAFNLIYLAATVLTAHGTYLLAKFVLAPAPASARGDASTGGLRWGPFVAGIAFAFCALRLGYGLAFTNLYHTELIPFYILFLLKTTRGQSWRDPVIAGALLGLNTYIDFQIAAFLVLFTALWFLFALAAARAEFRSQLKQWPRWVTAGVMAAVVAAPLAALVASDFRAEGSNYIRVYPLNYSAARSYDVLSYLLPNARSSLYQNLPAPRVAGINAAVNVDGESQLSPDRQAFLGWTVLGLALYGLVRRPRALAFWLVATIFFALLSFGPTLRLAGRDLSLPLPYAALHALPLANNIRIPMRYGLIVFLGAALLAGAGVQALAARFPAARAGGIAGALILLEAVVLPYPILNFSIPPVYQTIAAQPGEFTILEIPTFNWRAAAQAQVFQLIHHKQLLRAYANRIAPEVADYFSLRQTPVVVHSLRVLEGAEEGSLSSADLAADRALAPAVIQFFNLRFAVLHRAWLDPDTAAQIDLYLREVLGARKISDEGDVAAYAFDPPAGAPNDLTLDLASDEALMYLGRGWQTEPLAAVDGESGRFLQDRASELYFEAAARELRFRAYSDSASVVIELELNGRSIGAVGLKQGWTDYTVPLPSGAAQDQLNELLLLHPALAADRIALSAIEIH